MNYKKRNGLWLFTTEAILVCIGSIILVSLDILILPMLLFYAALKISILGAIENMLDEKFKEFNSRNTAISYTDESD